MRETKCSGLFGPRIMFCVLEIQTAFAGAVGQGFDATMIQVATSVEYYFANACGLGAFGNQFADCLGLGRLGRFCHFFVECRADTRVWPCESSITCA
jgi:hypothetical protein